MKKHLLIFIFALATTTAVNAQAALLVLIFGDKAATENFHLSIDIGMNFSSLPGLEKQEGTHGLYYGLGTFIKLSDKWALTPEFKPVSPRGAKYVPPIKDYSTVLTDVTYNIALKYIDVPVLVQYRITPRFFASAGPQISFLTSAKQVSEGKLPAGNNVKVEENFKSDFESLYFSVPLEVGYSISKARKGKGLDIKLRYNIGVSEMIKNTSYGTSRGSTFQVFLSFPFVKEKE
jgi:hypothetical protein